MAKLTHEEEVSTIKIFITFILLVLAIIGYIAVNKYTGSDPTATEEEIVSKTGDEELSDDDALTIGTEKYYIAAAILTNTKTDINTVYNLVKTASITLEDSSLVSSLNDLGGNFESGGVVSQITNYEDSIESNFTEDYINDSILSPNGFIGNINDTYYIVKDKVDNYFFKEIEISLTNKETDSLEFSVTVTKYSDGCASGTGTPSITCTDTLSLDPVTFKLVKEDSKWKVTEFNIN